jgi:hypothetical protein
VLLVSVHGCFAPYLCAYGKAEHNGGEYMVEQRCSPLDLSVARKERERQTERERQRERERESSAPNLIQGLTPMTYFLLQSPI